MKRITFQEYVENRQRVMFQTRPTELFHGTNSEAIESFLRDGVKPHSASGHGQGSGFYVWGDKRQAAHHAVKFLGDQPGLPAIVTIEEVMEPEEWDLDYELHGRFILRWITENWEEIKHDLSHLIDVEGSKTLGRGGQLMPDAPGTGIYFSPHSSREGPFERKKGMWGQKDDDPGDHTDPHNASVIGTLFRELQQGKNKELTHAFEEKFFANLPPVAAVKYVGNRTLPVKNVEYLKDGQWVAAGGASKSL